MENTRSLTGKKRYNRLLIFCFVCLFFFVMPNAIAQEESLQFLQQGDLIVAQESEFSIQLEGLSPSEIELFTIDFPEGVVFVSSTKSDGFVRSSSGQTVKATTISYVVRFSKAGVYELDNLPIMINSKLQSISFPSVTVLPNPNLLFPELILEQNGDFYALEEGSFTISVRYCKSVEDIQVGLSEHALIEQKDLLLNIPTDDLPLSVNAIPVALYSCKPFSQGKLLFPDVTATVTAYNGTQHTVAVKNTQLHVFEQRDTTNSIYGNERSVANFEQYGVNDSSESIVRNEDLVEELALLRIQEKYSFFPFSARAERIKLENQEGINNKNEVSYIWVSGGIVLAVLIIFCTAGLYWLTKKRGGNAFSRYIPLAFALGVILLVVSCFFGRPLLKQYALTYGAQLYTIPEYESRIVSTLPAGLRLEINRSVGDWYLVKQEHGQSGWIQKKDCITIEREM